MVKKLSDEIRLYCNPYSLLVIDRYNKLLRIYCPFKVIVRIKVSPFNLGDEAYVKKVMEDRKNNLIFIIKDQAYFSHYFRITL